MASISVALNAAMLVSGARKPLASASFECPFEGLMMVSIAPAVGKLTGSVP